MIRGIVIFCLFLIISCKSKRLNSDLHLDDNFSSLAVIAEEKFDKNYFIVMSQSGRYSLVKNKTKKFKEIGFDISYFVFDSKTEEILIEDNLKSGFVDWIDEHKIKAVNRKVLDDKSREKEIYLFDVHSQEKVFIENR